MQSDLIPVTFNMAWLPQGSMSGVLVAIERGLYRDVGLDVSAVRGFGGIRTVNEIDQGMFDFGYGDPLAVILNRSQGRPGEDGGGHQPKVAGGALLRERPARRSRPQSRPSKGLTVGGGRAARRCRCSLPMWLAANGVSRRRRHHDAARSRGRHRVAPRRADRRGGVLAGEQHPAVRKAGRKRRASRSRWIEYGAFGLDIYGNGLVTSEALISESPDVVQEASCTRPTKATRSCSRSPRKRLGSFSSSTRCWMPR